MLGSVSWGGAGAAAEAAASATIGAADLDGIVRATGQAIGRLRLNVGGRPGGDSLRGASRNCGTGVQPGNNDSAMPAFIVSKPMGN
jgi:hypothetical protein